MKSPKNWIIYNDGDDLGIEHIEFIGDEEIHHCIAITEKPEECGWSVIRKNNQNYKIKTGFIFEKDCSDCKKLRQRIEELEEGINVFLSNTEEMLDIEDKPMGFCQIDISEINELEKLLK